MASGPPPFDRMASTSSSRTLRTNAQDSSHRTPLEGQSESTGPDDIPQAFQNSASKQHRGQSSGNVRRNTALPEPPPSMSIDPQPFDLNELRQGQVHTQVHGDLDGAGQSRTNLQSTPGDRNASRRDVRSRKDSRGPPVRDNDEGRRQPGVRPNFLEASCMALALTLVYPYLT